jgi:hypothetical protein
MSVLKDALTVLFPIPSIIGAELPQGALPGTTVVKDLGLGADSQEQSAVTGPFAALLSPSIDFLFWGALATAGVVGFYVYKNRKKGTRSRGRSRR